MNTIYNINTNNIKIEVVLNLNILRYIHFYIYINSITFFLILFNIILTTK